MSKRIATEEEKREAMIATLTDVVEGEHGLSRMLGRHLPLEVEEDDFKAILARMMRTPKQIEVFELLEEIVYKPTMAGYLSKQQMLLQVAIEPRIKVVFKHFNAPSLADGGWEKCKASNPQNKAWLPYYKAYEELIVNSERNARNLRLAREHNLPKDLVITTCWDEQGVKEEDRLPVMIRFVIFDPLEENQKGFDGYVTRVEKPNNTNTKK